MVMNPRAEHVQQAIVLQQLFELMRLALARQVVGGRAQHPAVVRGHRQGHKAGVFRLAVTQGDIHRLAEQVGNPVTQ